MSITYTKLDRSSAKADINEDGCLRYEDNISIICTDKIISWFMSKKSAEKSTRHSINKIIASKNATLVSIKDETGNSFWIRDPRGVVSAALRSSRLTADLEAESNSDFLCIERGNSIAPYTLGEILDAINNENTDK
jgi:hypothetical protein